MNTDPFWLNLLRPFAFLALMVGIVLPIEWALNKVLPDCSLKRVLFDRTLRERRPWVFMAWWTVLMALLVGSLLAAFYPRWH